MYLYVYFLICLSKLEGHTLCGDVHHVNLDYVQKTPKQVGTGWIKRKASNQFYQKNHSQERKEGGCAKVLISKICTPSILQRLKSSNQTRSHSMTIKNEKAQEIICWYHRLLLEMNLYNYMYIMHSMCTSHSFTLPCS